MRAVDIVRKKREGHPLAAEEIDAFVHGVTSGTWPDYQASALLMAIYLNDMNAHETARLTHAMVHSGKKLDWGDLPGPKVDKHSTGGVGDKTSMILAPLAAACGAIVPMMSGRGLGHTGGTLDKLESIPGFRVDLNLNEFRHALRKIGCALIGQTAEIAPADKKLYALRDVTGTVESIPLITGSIMSKKIAEGIDGLVLDVKCGQGAFMKSRERALALARSLVETGKANGLRTEALVTAMETPLGRAVGNALEIKESIETLRGNGPRDLEQLSITLASRMLIVAGLQSDEGESENAIRTALGSGQGVERFRRIVELQGGDPRCVEDMSLLPASPHQMVLKAERSGYVIDVAAETVGRACMLLGAGRDRVEDKIDPAVGCVILAQDGQKVSAGDGLVEIHYRDGHKLQSALPLFREAWQISDETGPLILEHVR